MKAISLTVGENDVSHSEESLPEDNWLVRWWSKSVVFRTRSSILDTDCNHGDGNSRKDTGKCYESQQHPNDALQENCSHAIDQYDTFFKVRGRSKSQNKTKATTPHTMLHTAWLVIVLKQIFQVKM